MIRNRNALHVIALGIMALTGCVGGGDSSSIEGISTQGDDTAATNLFHAAELGDLAAMQEFVSQGQTLSNRHAENQRTVLHYAAWGGNTNTIVWLLDQKADINALDAEGKTPLDFAWMPRSESAQALLLTLGAKPGSELRPPEPIPATPTETAGKEAAEAKPSDPQP